MGGASLSQCRYSTGQIFTSSPEFLGLQADNGDFFTTPQRNNLSSIIFDVYATGDNDQSNGIVVFGYANRTSTSPQPFPPQQIVLLTDAFCSSACATFVELMHRQAGVRTVVAGGTPEYGPMQAVGGTRGAQSYTSVALDQDIAVAEILNSSITDVLPDRSVGNYILSDSISKTPCVRAKTFHCSSLMKRPPAEYSTHNILSIIISTFGTM